MTATSVAELAGATRQPWAPAPTRRAGVPARRDRSSPASQKLPREERERTHDARRSRARVARCRRPPRGPARGATAPGPLPSSSARARRPAAPATPRRRERGARRRRARSLPVVGATRYVGDGAGDVGRQLEERRGRQPALRLGRSLRTKLARARARDEPELGPRRAHSARVPLQVAVADERAGANTISPLALSPGGAGERVARRGARCQRTRTTLPSRSLDRVAAPEEHVRERSARASGTSPASATFVLTTTSRSAVSTCAEDDGARRERRLHADDPDGGGAARAGVRSRPLPARRPVATRLTTPRPPTGGASAQPEESRPDLARVARWPLQPARARRAEVGDQLGPARLVLRGAARASPRLIRTSSHRTARDRRPRGRSRRPREAPSQTDPGSLPGRRPSGDRPPEPRSAGAAEEVREDEDESPGRQRAAACRGGRARPRPRRGRANGAASRAPRTPRADSVRGASQTGSPSPSPVERADDRARDALSAISSARSGAPRPSSSQGSSGGQSAIAGRRSATTTTRGDSSANRSRTTNASSLSRRGEPGRRRPVDRRACVSGAIRSRSRDIRADPRRALAQPAESETDVTAAEDERKRRRPPALTPARRRSRCRDLRRGRARGMARRNSSMRPPSRSGGLGVEHRAGTRCGGRARAG